MTSLVLLEGNSHYLRSHERCVVRETEEGHLKSDALIPLLKTVLTEVDLVNYEERASLLAWLHHIL